MPLRSAVIAAIPRLSGLPWECLRGGRCNRLWRAGDVVIKLCVPEAASPLFPNDFHAEARMLRALGPLGLAPELLAAGSGWLAYAHVPGVAWRNDPPVAARALAAIHAVPFTGLRIVGSGSDALVAQGLAILRGCSGALPEPPQLQVAPVAQPGLIHGDAVPGNMIVQPQGVRLIDWQCPARGDPAEDLAMFLSPAMQWLYRGAVLTQAEEAVFLAAFAPDLAARYRALAPAFHWRMAAHCLWRAERGADDYRAAMALELAALDG